MSSIERRPNLKSESTVYTKLAGDVGGGGREGDELVLGELEVTRRRDRAPVVFAPRVHQLLARVRICRENIHLNLGCSESPCSLLETLDFVSFDQLSSQQKNNNKKAEF